MSHHGENRPFVQVDQAAVFKLVRELDLSDFKVFFFLTMRAYGWDDEKRRVGDGITRASGTFVANGTGLSEATSEKCIRSLKELGLISKFHHSCKWGNTYSVKPLLLRHASNEVPVTEDRKEHQECNEPFQSEKPKNEVPKLKGPKAQATTTLENTPLEAQNLGTNLDCRPLDLSLKLSFSEIFETHFSKCRSPKIEMKERDCWAEIQERNPKVTSEEFLECFEVVSETKDSKGNSIFMKFLWMLNGFDPILAEAKRRLETRKRLVRAAQEQEAPSKTVDNLEQITSAEDAEAAEQAKAFIRALLDKGPFKSPSLIPQTQPEQDRIALLRAQAKQMQHIENFGSL